MPSVSIILPTYNSVAIIQPTLDSIFAQTYTDFELLIVDDGSTDETVNLVRQLTDPRVRVYAFENAGVGGPSAGRNRGLELAGGEYIALINHDDLWSPNKLAAQVRALDGNPQAMVVYSWLDHIDMAGNVVYRGSQSSATGDVFDALLRGNFIETGSNPLIRRKAFELAGPFDHSFRLTSDWEMLLRLAKQFEFVNVPQVQIFFRDVPSALSTNTRRMEQDAIKLFEHMFTIAPDAISYRHESFGNFYEYLASRTLKGKPSNHKAKEATRFLVLGLRHDPSVLFRKKRRLICLTLKILAYVFLTRQQTAYGLAIYQRYFREYSAESKPTHARIPKSRPKIAEVNQ